MKSESFNGWDDPSSLFNIDYTEFARIAKPARIPSSTPKTTPGRRGSNRSATVHPARTFRASSARIARCLQRRDTSRIAKARGRERPCVMSGVRLSLHRLEQ
jgi:hypothetical protein